MRPLWQLVAVKISSQLIVAYLAIATLVALVAGVSIKLSGQIWLLRRIELPMEQSLREVEVSAWETIHAADAFAISGDSAYLDLYRRQLADVDRYFASYERLCDAPVEAEFTAEFRKHWSEAKQHGDRLISAAIRQRDQESKLVAITHAVTKVLAGGWPSTTFADARDLQTLEALSRVQVGVWQVLHAFTEHLAPGAKGSSAALSEQVLSQTEQAWESFVALADSDAERRLIQEVERVSGGARAGLERSIQLREEVKSHFASLYQSVDKADDVIDYKMQTFIDSRVQSRDAFARGARVLTICLGCIAMIAALTIGFLMVRSIHRPLAKLQDAVRRLGAGDLESRVNSTQANEIGDLSRAFDAMGDQLKGTAEELLRENAERRRAEHVAEEASRAKSEFLANMSHEIRTPMTAILGFTDILMHRAENDSYGEEAISEIKTIQRNGEFLTKILNDILDLSKVESGRMEIELLPTSICELLNDVERLMQPVAVAKCVTLDIQYLGPIPDQIPTDPTRLRQILVNVIGNAIKFTEVGSVTVAIALVAKDGQATIHFDVTDTGIGMSADQIANLFQPFTQADASTTRRFGGTGLGLAISRRLAQVLGGDLCVMESRVGEGSRVRISIAAGSSGQIELLGDPNATAIHLRTPAAAPPSTATSLAGYRILLVEDGPDNQLLISHLLRRVGAEITIEENGQAGCEAALAAANRGAPFDTILMDMQMPVMDGYEASRSLRDQGYDGFIIALTAHAMAGDREKCLAAGCDDYATKPIQIEGLAEQIRVALKV